MKVRSGFVSNSSSASYIIKINMELNNFVETIFEEFQFGYFNVDNHIEDKEKQIKQYQKNIELQKDNPLRSLKFYSEEGLIELQNDLEMLNKLKDLNSFKPYEEGQFDIDKVQAIKWILQNIFGVGLNSISSDYIELVGSSSMHNSYDDVPEVLKAIITYFNFAKPEIKIFYKKESY